MSTDPSADEKAVIWRFPTVKGVEFFRATFVTHTYNRHTHPEYAIGATERGAQTFQCRGRSRVAGQSVLSLINPDEAHDGRSSASTGYTYRMIYVEPVALAEFLRYDDTDLAGTPLPFFLEPVVEDASLASQFLACHAALQRQEAGVLEAESRLIALLARLFARHADHREKVSPKGHGSMVQSICDYIQAHYQADLSLTDLAVVAGVSRFRLLRQFAREMGLPPHAYLTQVRLQKARRLLLAGEPQASVAPAVGFVDQSHLIKRFRSAFGFTPGQYIAAAQAGLEGVREA